MALTRFPIETTNPRIEVTLPVGRHVLELVVEDSAGLRSAPDQIVIEVRKEVVVPVITGILPVSGIRGATVEAVISGTGLTGATSVVFSGTGVTASVGSGGTAEKLPVKIAIAADAALGARNFRVATPNGNAVSPAGVAFSVAAEPRVIMEPLPLSTRPIVIEPTPVATNPITVEPIPTGVRPVVVDPAPVATRPIVVEPLAITPEVRAVTPEVRAIIAEPRLVTPEVRPVVETRAITPEVVTPATPVIEARAVTPDIVRVPTVPTRVVTPGKAATTKKSATAKKTPTTRKKK